MLPDQPPATRAPGPQDPHGQPWWWRLEDAAGAEVEVPDQYAGRRFPHQGDAESWVGEIWAALAEHGVAAVTLFEVDRKVYGPMSLSA